MDENLVSPKEEPTEKVDSLFEEENLHVLVEDRELDNFENIPVERLAVLSESYKELHELVFEIRGLIKDRLSRDEVKEQAFERLYSELDTLKRNKEFEDNRSLYVDLFLFYDRIGKVKNEGSEPFFEILESLQEELQEIFLRRDIHIVKVDGLLFDPRIHKAVRTQKIENPDLDGTILCVLRDGFEFKGNILRPQEVVVGRYQTEPRDF